MAKPISFGKIDVNVVSSMEDTHGVPEAETPFRIAILGDFQKQVLRDYFMLLELDVQCLYFLGIQKTYLY